MQPFTLTIRDEGMDQQPTDIPGNVLYQTHSQNSGISALRVQNQPDDQTVSLLVNGPCPILEGRNLPVKTENFAENQNEYHSDVNSRLLHVGTHTLQKRINLLETKHSNVYKMNKHWGQGKKKGIPHLPQSRLYTRQLRLRAQPTALLPSAWILCISSINIHDLPRSGQFWVGIWCTYSYKLVFWSGGGFTCPAIRTEMTRP